MNHSTLAARLLVLIVVLVGATTRAEIPRPGWQQDGTLQAIFDRIHDHASHEAWKQGGFQDEVIEKWLDKVVGSVAKAAEFPELALPVRLSEVKAGAEGQNRMAIVGPITQNRLIIGRDLDLKEHSIKKSVILADGSVTAMGVEECIIVARGAVTIQMRSSSSIIVSGVYVKLAQYDGMPRNATNGSLVLSRGWADVATGYGTMIAAREGITVGRMEGATYLNAPVPAPPNIGGFALGRDSGSKSVKVPDLVIEPLPEHPMSQRIELLGISHAVLPAAGLFGRDQRAFGPRGIVFRFNDRTHVAELREEIIDEAGAPVEGLQNWRLSNIGPKFAILVGPEANVVLRLEKKP